DGNVSARGQVADVDVAACAAAGVAGGILQRIDVQVSADNGYLLVLTHDKGAAARDEIKAVAGLVALEDQRRIRDLFFVISFGAFIGSAAARIAGKGTLVEQDVCPAAVVGAVKREGTELSMVG